MNRQSFRPTAMRTALLSVILLLGACATPPPPSRPAPIPVPRVPEKVAPVSSPEQEILRPLIAQQDRLDRVAAPLLVGNAQLCKARNLLGFTAKNKYSYSEEFAEAAKQVLGLDEKLQVTGVMAGSGAAQAGVQRGDILIAIEDKAIPQGPNAEEPAKAILAPLVSKRTSVKLTVLRNRTNIELNVPLTSACAFRVELGNADHVNAYADGQRVMITRGMLGFTFSDEELAYVLAREMAHNALGHPARQHMSATVGGIIDNLVRMHPDLSAMAGTAGVKTMPPELDAMADKLALYMLARAGYAIDNVQPFWQRLTSHYPATVLNGYTVIHPTSALRASAIKKAIADIKAKQASGKPILP
jgi:hypothetical protein